MSRSNRSNAIQNIGMNIGKSQFLVIQIESKQVTKPKYLNYND